MFQQMKKSVFGQNFRETRICCSEKRWPRLYVVHKTKGHSFSPQYIARFFKKKKLKKKYVIVFHYFSSQNYFDWKNSGKRWRVFLLTFFLKKSCNILCGKWMSPRFMHNIQTTPPFFWATCQDLSFLGCVESEMKMNRFLNWAPRNGGGRFVVPSGRVGSDRFVVQKLFQCRLAGASAG